MNITSYHFVLFIILVLGVYYFLPRRSQNYWLLLASYAFIVSWDWQFAIALAVITICQLPGRVARAGQRSGAARIALGGNRVQPPRLVVLPSRQFLPAAIRDVAGRIGHIHADGRIANPDPAGPFLLCIAGHLLSCGCVSRTNEAESDLMDFALCTLLTSPNSSRVPSNGRGPSCRNLPTPHCG
jgi:hypothetical protein